MTGNAFNDRTKKNEKKAFPFQEKKARKENVIRMIQITGP